MAILLSLNTDIYFCYFLRLEIRYMRIVRNEPITTFSFLHTKYRNLTRLDLVGTIRNQTGTEVWMARLPR